MENLAFRHTQVPTSRSRRCAGLHDVHEHAGESVLDPHGPG